MRPYIVPLWIATAVFVVGLTYSLFFNWSLVGWTASNFRSLPKQKQISLLRSIGEHFSPYRVRAILLATYPHEPPEAHELAHLIGETAYAKSDAKGFSYCDSSFTFACYHGVILAALRLHGYDEGILRGLADGCSEAGKNDTAKVSCAHGIGHGIMWVKNYDLVPSFELCDSIFDDITFRFFCWDGVSMENVVRRADNAMNLPAHPWREDNIYYPCDAVPIQYQPACVREHLFLLRLTVFERDTDKSIAYCLYFKNRSTQEQCFGALGGALVQDDPENLTWIGRECLKTPHPFEMNCIGRAATQYAFSGRKKHGVFLCNEIADSVAKASCLNSLDTADAARYIITQ